ncbi:hypothetical protein NMG60_11004517 [Bertholletia excelsa]
MAVDFWASRVHSARNVSVLQAAGFNQISDNCLNMDDSDGDDDARAYFPCPFCYIEIELQVFCSHLQEEHCFDLKNAVCPLCAAILGKEATEHFQIQHSHSVKKRRKCQKPGIWNNNFAMLGRDFPGLSSSLGSNSMPGTSHMYDPAPDPLLSPFLCSVPLSETKSNQEEECSGNLLPSTSDVTSTTPSRAEELEEQDYEERMQRAEFFQGLIFSTIF